MGYLSVRPCQPRGQIRVSGGRHPADPRAHLRADPLIKGIAVNTALRRKNAVLYVSDRQLLRGPSAWDQSHPGQSHIQGGYLVALLSKGVQKRQFKGNIVIVGIWFPEIRPDISKGFLKIFRGIPLHHGSHGASHKLGHPACPDLFLELRGTAVHLHRLRKTDLPFVLLKGMIIMIVPVRIALLFSGLRQLPAQQRRYLMQPDEILFLPGRKPLV